MGLFSKREDDAESVVLSVTDIGGLRPEPKTVDLREKLVGLGVRRPDRAIERGLTEEDMLWNERLGRPPEFVETVDPVVEVERRAAWLMQHGEK